MEPLTTPIRWGIAGTGKIAGRFAADFARLTTSPAADEADGSARIVAVGSRAASTAAAFAESHDIERHHGSYEDLAADPEVDAVYVAGLHPVHAPQTVAFLAAGKHVLVEKPMALNAAEADAMIGAAEANDRFLMEAMWMRFNPTHREIRRRIDAGAIGEPRRVVADFSLGVPHDPEHRLWDRAKGGGALLDLGIYPLHLAWMMLGGPPVRVEHAAHVIDGVDAEIALLAGWPDDATALLTAGLRFAGPITARIEGTEGSIDLPAPAHACDRATWRAGGVTEEIVGAAPGLHHQVAEVHRCLRTGERESPLMPWATSRATLALFDGIRADLGVVYDADGG